MALVPSYQHLAVLADTLVKVTQMAWQPGSYGKMTHLPKATSIALSVYSLIKWLEMLWFVIMLRFKYPCFMLTD